MQVPSLVDHRKTRLVDFQASVGPNVLSKYLLLRHSIVLTNIDTSIYSVTHVDAEGCIRGLARTFIINFIIFCYWDTSVASVYVSCRILDHNALGQGFIASLLILFYCVYSWFANLCSRVSHGCV